MGLRHGLKHGIYTGFQMQEVYDELKQARTEIARLEAVIKMQRAFVEPLARDWDHPSMDVYDDL